MYIEDCDFDHAHPLGEPAMYPIARLASRLAALLLLAGSDHGIVAPCQTTRQTHTRACSTEDSRLIAFPLGAKNIGDGPSQWAVVILTQPDGQKLSSGHSLVTDSEKISLTFCPDSISVSN